MNKFSTRALVGVFGRTDEKNPKDGEVARAAADDDLFKMAASVGEELTRRGHVVLCGGSHRRPEVSVKYAAIFGALRTATEESFARVIGILPKDISKVTHPKENTAFIEYDTDHRQKLRYAYLHTFLDNEQRDPITGASPDVVIALTGVRGTPREVAAALKSYLPVVFLNSDANLLRSTCEALGNDKDLFPSHPVTARSAVEAVDKALDEIDWIGKRLALRSSLRKPLGLRNFKAFHDGIASAVSAVLV